MKNFNFLIAYSILTLFFMMSCQDEPKFGDVIAPTNIVVTAEVIGQDTENPYGDGSGTVNFSASADNAATYRYVAIGIQEDASSGDASITFTSLGVNTYEVVVIAFGAGGVSSSTTIQVEVLVTYAPPADLIEKLVGNGSKTWRIKSEKPGHFGLGPVGGNIPTEWYGAQPEEKAGAGMYDDRYVFNIDGSFTHITDNTNDDPTNNTNGTVFGRDGLIQQLGGVGGGELEGADVLNYVYEDYAATWQIIAPGGVETIVLPGTAFMGYYIGGSHQYRIFDRSVANEMIITSADGNGEFNWWFIITSEEPETGFESDYTDLVWEDNFDTNGAPNAANWTYDLGAGGWGNNESQTYTNSSDNVIVEDGFLKITAISTGGGNYTSSRIKSENLFEFTYGRVEVRAKLPEGGGTWPAIWMLGANYDSPEFEWPACGEIDIMEHVGNNQNQVHGTLHYPGNSGGNANGASTTVPTASTEFHNYTVDWSPTAIRILVDDSVYFTFPNTSTTPFNNDFFLILNVAMGGTFGGAIDPNFTQSTLEIDYVRVYQ
jgi:hypothetical protein